jgi:putative signal transducing protein
MDFVTVSRAANSADADLIRSRLEANGFQVNLNDEKDTLSFGYGAPLGGVQVQVAEDQAESARALLGSQDSPSS